MNLKRNTVLAGAVAAALGLTAGSALAAGTINGPSSVLPYVQEITPPATLTWNYHLYGTIGFGVSAGQSVFLRFNLSNNGAQFATLAPTLSVSTTAGVTPVAVSLVSGGSGAGFVIYQVTAPSVGLSQAATYGLWPGSPSSFDVTGTTGSVAISYAEYANSPDAVAQTGALASASTSLLSFAQTLMVASQAGTPLNIDVASNDTLFAGGLSTSPIGQVAIGALTGRQTAGGTPAAYSLLASSGTLLVSGDFSAATPTTSGFAPADVFLSTAANCSSPTTPAAYVTANQAVFYLGAEGTFNGSGPLTYATVCYKVAGTAPIAFGVTYTGTFYPYANPGYTLPASIPLTFGTLDTNGRTATVLNIPNATNVDQPYIRIYNTSSLAGPIRGTLYAQDGTVLYSGVLIPSLAAGKVQVLTAQDLETLAGTSWTGRAYLKVFGQIPGMDVQSLIRDANGTLVNVSGKAPTQ